MRGGRRTPRGKGLVGVALPRRSSTGAQEAGPERLHRGTATRHRGDQRVRHGRRQARRAPCRARRHPWLVGELPAGSGPRRSRRRNGQLRASLHGGRRGTPVRARGTITTHPVRDRWDLPRAAEPEDEERPQRSRSGQRSGRDAGRDPARRRRARVPARHQHRRHADQDGHRVA